MNDNVAPWDARWRCSRRVCEMLVGTSGSLVHSVGNCFSTWLCRKRGCICTGLSFEAFVQQKIRQTVASATERACPRRKMWRVPDPAHWASSMQSWGHWRYVYCSKRLNCFYIDVVLLYLKEAFFSRWLGKKTILNKVWRLATECSLPQ